MWGARRGDAIAPGARCGHRIDGHPGSSENVNTFVHKGIPWIGHTKIPGAALAVIQLPNSEPTAPRDEGLQLSRQVAATPGRNQFAVERSEMSAKTLGSNLP